MKWNNSDPYNDTLTTRGLLIVGGAVLFAHFLFPFIWWNFFGGSTHSEQPSFNDIPSHYRVVTYTPLPTPTLQTTPTPKQYQEQTLVPKHHLEHLTITEPFSIQHFVWYSTKTPSKRRIFNE